MLPMRFVAILVVLLAAQAWCKPAKNAESEDYHDDDPPSDYDDNVDDDDDPGTSEDPPQIVSKAQVIHATNGSTISLPCLVKNTEHVAVTWKRNDENLYYDSTPMTSDSNRIVRLQNNTLVIHNVTVNDTSDDYECTILQDPPITIKHKVVVETDKVRVYPAKTVTANAGETITLGCDTSMQPAPEIKWYHKSKKIHAESPSNRLVIRNVSKHDNGVYHCLAEDGSKHPPVGIITVVINYAPEIEDKKESVHTGLGVESELMCVIHAHPSPRVHWYKDQKEVQAQAGKIEMRTDKNRHILKILHTEEQDLGKYKCVAVNNLGKTEKIFTLTGAPSQAAVFGTEVTRTDRGLILKWRLQSYSPITEYKLEYRRKGEHNWISLKPTVTNGQGNQFTVKHEIEGLQPESYEAILTARNEFGWSQPSKPFTFTGEYVIEEAENVEGPSGVASQPTLALTTLFLVVSCAFTNL
ncbi:opioid-binding protein/cell adhesion molecule homolog [Megalopta genalis]|uniref:opioid-binding protein/cell adhesion molecule homolog n=1 Tax=Megalopta genalis TaxID=115081 RepID=UPI003FCFCBF8